MPTDAYGRTDSNSSATGSENEMGNGENLGTSPGANSSTSSNSNASRLRTDSESSDRELRFILPGTGDSPPKILSMNDVQNFMKNMQNMSLAHEIAVNPDFKLEPYEPPVDSIEKRVREIVHTAFWDLFKEQLSQDPPCFDHAIQLLGDIKENFKHVILKNNQKVLDCINEVLDETLIRQQAEQGVLDFKSYTSFIIEIMAKSCAPIRDDEIEKLNEIDDVVQLFRRILEVLTLMRLDMANCLLEATRLDFIANSVAYEKKKFKEYLELCEDGFPSTEVWLKRNIPSDHETLSHWDDITILNAYMEFLDWNDENEFPEILLLDKDRFLSIPGRALRMSTLACVLAIAGSYPILGQNSVNKLQLIKHIKILLEDVNNYKDLEETIENVWLEIKSMLTKLLQKDGFSLDDQRENALKTQIISIAKKDSPVRIIMWKRLVQFMRLARTSKNIPPAPPGYTDLTDDLVAFSNIFNRLTLHNYSVYGEHYHDVLKLKCQVQSSSTIQN